MTEEQKAEILKEVERNGYSRTHSRLLRESKNNQNNSLLNLPVLLDYIQSAYSRKYPKMPRGIPNKKKAVEPEAQENKSEAAEQSFQENLPKEDQGGANLQSPPIDADYEKQKQNQEEAHQENLKSDVPHIDKIKNIGSKEEVFQGLAKQTKGKLKQEDLMKNSKGSVVSKKKHESGLKNADRLKASRPKKKEEKKE